MKNRDHTIYCDVDETIIRSLEIDEISDITFKFEDDFFEKKVNYNLIKYLNNKSQKGCFIVLWTSNSLGVKWAEKVKEVLNLTCVDICLFKPTEIIDDCPINEISHFKYITPEKF